MIISAVILVIPYHKEFVSTGDIVSVEELGIQGNVHFTYVQSGVTENLLDRIIISATNKDVKFMDIQPKDYEMYSSYLESTEVYKSETVSNAVQHTLPQPANEPDELQSRAMEIMDQAAGYYGDSLGLMVAIGLIEETHHIDYSRNNSLIISGTGTLNDDRSVGEVGAIRLKLLTAEQNRVDYFFLPRNLNSNDKYISNHEAALEIVEEEKLSLELVPVATLDEAIAFLEFNPY
ncbi:hypothetical protein KO561_18270 [Radiobacillus kanasensis]|uniref:hypothetical protein n=1 Tax=Radiobacillus kanasensis TaxID=2844358 RepID=UPI001E3B65E3|nr:hypothetical protein [Radiobacillus kanasensis]UFT99102.1 hypothetical protein KO561_18270 [Radiobacillus kanasensis]